MCVDKNSRSGSEEVRSKKIMRKGRGSGTLLSSSSGREENGSSARCRTELIKLISRMMCMISVR